MMRSLIKCKTELYSYKCGRFWWQVRVCKIICWRYHITRRTAVNPLMPVILSTLHSLNNNNILEDVIYVDVQRLTHSCRLFCQHYSHWTITTSFHCAKDNYIILAIQILKLSKILRSLKIHFPSSCFKQTVVYNSHKNHGKTVISWKPRPQSSPKYRLSATNILVATLCGSIVNLFIIFTHDHRTGNAAYSHQLLEKAKLPYSWKPYGLMNINFIFFYENTSSSMADFRDGKF